MASLLSASELWWDTFRVVLVSLLKEPSVLVLGPKPESKLDCLLLASVGSKESSSKPAKQEILRFITIVFFNPIWHDLRSYVEKWGWYFYLPQDSASTETNSTSYESPNTHLIGAGWTRACHYYEDKMPTSCKSSMNMREIKVSLSLLNRVKV